MVGGSSSQASLLICYNPLDVMWKYGANSQHNILMFRLNKRKFRTPLSFLFSMNINYKICTIPTKKMQRNCNWEIIEMKVGDTFKVRKPPNSLFLDTMEVLNKESWSLLCSSYQWGAKLSSCYCHLITLHCSQTTTLTTPSTPLVPPLSTSTSTAPS